MDERQKKRLEEALTKVKQQYEADRRNALPIRSGTKLQITLNLFWVGFNLYKFSTDGAKEGATVTFNYIIMFFLLLMNLPIVGYKENKFASLFIFFALLIFLGLFVFMGYNESVKLILLMWFPNYLKSVFSTEKEKENLGGTTVYYILFWVALLLASVALNIFMPEALPKNYDYGFLINALYSLAAAYLLYISDKYRMMNPKVNLKPKSKF